MKGTLLRFVTGSAVVGALIAVIAVPVASAAVTVPAMPIVSIASPAPNAYIPRGRTWITGTACDPNASLSDPTAGIARVQVFLGDRDTAVDVPWYRPGGYFGAATLSGFTPGFSDNAALTSRLGVVNPDVSSGCKNTFAGWRVLPSSMRRGIYTMNIYVLTKAGAEAKVSQTIRVDMP